MARRARGASAMGGRPEPYQNSEVRHPQDQGDGQRLDRTQIQHPPVGPRQRQHTGTHARPAPAAGPAAQPLRQARGAGQPRPGPAPAAQGQRHQGRRGTASRLTPTVAMVASVRLCIFATNSTCAAPQAAPSTSAPTRRPAQRRRQPRVQLGSSRRPAPASRSEPETTAAGPARPGRPAPAPRPRTGPAPGRPRRPAGRPVRPGPARGRGRSGRRPAARRGSRPPPRACNQRASILGHYHGPPGRKGEGPAAPVRRP